MIDFTQWIDLRAFFVAFIIGTLFAYLRISRPKIVYRYPTPWNAGKVTYIDEADVCYKYRVDKVTCPSDKSKIAEIPLQFREDQDIVSPKQTVPLSKDK
jgi:hypothetical protein